LPTDCTRTITLLRRRLQSHMGHPKGLPKP